MTIVGGSPFQLTEEVRLARLRSQAAESESYRVRDDYPLATASFSDTNARAGQDGDRAGPAAKSSNYSILRYIQQCTLAGLSRLNVNKIKLSFMAVYETKFIVFLVGSNTCRTGFNCKTFRRPATGIAGASRLAVCASG